MFKTIVSGILLLFDGLREGMAAVVMRWRRYDGWCFSNYCCKSSRRRQMYLTTCPDFFCYLHLCRSLPRKNRYEG